MAIPADIERKRDLSVEQIRGSGLDPAAQEEVIENLMATAASTNGLTHEEKIQAMSINQFEMARSDARIHLMMADGFRRVEARLAELKPMTRLDAIVRCRWQIVILGAIVALMLILKPELAAYLELLRR